MEEGISDGERALKVKISSNFSRLRRFTQGLNPISKQVDWSFNPSRTYARAVTAGMLGRRLLTSSSVLSQAEEMSCE